MLIDVTCTAKSNQHAQGVTTHPEVTFTPIAGTANNVIVWPNGVPITTFKFAPLPDDVTNGYTVGGAYTINVA